MIKLAYSNADQRGDLGRADGANLETDDGLETAVTISLFTDARAREGDDVDPGADKRGWWGAAYLDGGGEIGSRLWQLKRSKVGQDGSTKAAAYARESLQWLVTNKVATSVTVTADKVGGRPDVTLLRVDIQRPKKAAPRWSRFWEVQLGI